MTRHSSWELLYKFQQTGVDKFNPEGEPGLPSVLLADGMGLGKTWSAVARDRELRLVNGGGPTLIVAPSGSHWNTWYMTIMAYEPRATVWIVDRKKRHVLEADIDSAKSGFVPWPQYIIIHYEGLRIMRDLLKQVEWFHIMCDEVHRVKNRTAQQTRALKALPTKYKTGISGTPADDKPQDIWSVLNWLWPKTFKSYWKFVNACCVFEDEGLQKAKYGRSFKKIVGVNIEGANLMLKAIRPNYLSRQVEDVGIDLPDMTWTERFVTLPPKQRKAYDQMRKDMIAWVGEHQETPLTAGAIVAQLVRLQQFALATLDFDADGKVTLIDPSVKLDDLEEIVDGNPDESLVVFSQSRGMSHLAVRRLEARGIVARPYTGTVSQHDRDRYEAQFQAGDIQVLCGTIAAGGESITLHRAHTVVFFDRAWNPNRNRQAEKRVHRIGQGHPVQVIDIIARDTVDLGRSQKIAGKEQALKMLALILSDKVPLENRAAYLSSDGVGEAVHDALSIFRS
jgi:SNF2 family DNA or RNA helicase